MSCWTFPDRASQRIMRSLRRSTTVYVASACRQTGTSACPMPAKSWRRDYNSVSPHSAIGIKPAVALINHAGVTSPPACNGRKNSNREWSRLGPQKNELAQELNERANLTGGPPRRGGPRCLTGYVLVRRAGRTVRQVLPEHRVSSGAVRHGWRDTHAYAHR